MQHTLRGYVAYHSSLNIYPTKLFKSIQFQTNESNDNP